MESLTTDNIIQYLEDLQNDNAENVNIIQTPTDNIQENPTNIASEQESDIFLNLCEILTREENSQKDKKKRAREVQKILKGIQVDEFASNFEKIKNLLLENNSLNELIQHILDLNDEAKIFNIYETSDIENDEDYEDSLFMLTDFLTKSNEKVEMIFKFLNTVCTNSIFSLYPLFSLVLRKLCKNSRLTDAMMLLRYAMMHNLEISTCSINCMIESLCRQEKYEESQQLFECLLEYTPILTFPEKEFNFKKLNLSRGVTVVTFGTFIKCLCKANYLPLALYYYDYLKKNRMIKNEVIFNLILDGCSKNSNIVAMKQVYFDMINMKMSPTIVTFNTIIDAYVRTNDLDSAWNIYEDLIGNGVTPDSFTYSTIFHGIRNSSHKKYLMKSIQILDKLKEGLSNIDIILVNVLLDSCISLKEINLMFEIFDKVKNDYYSPLRPDIITYNTYIKGCAQINDFNRAYCAFNQMLKEVNPNDVTFNTMIDVCVRTNNMTHVWKVIELMKDYDIKPDNFTYSTIIKGLNKDGDKWENEAELNFAINLFKNVKKFSKPDEILYNCLMDACLRFKKYDMMMEFYDEMQQDGVKPSSITCGIIIKMYGMTSRLDKAFEMYEEMKRENINLSSVTYGCLINACIKNDNIKKALELYKEIEDNGVEMNTILYTTLIKVYSRMKNLQKVMEIFNKMKKDKNLSPNNITYNSVIDSCIKNEEIALAEKLFSEMKRNGLKPDIITFSTLIKGCLKSQELNKAIDYLLGMKQFNISPDEVLLNSLLDGCDKMKKYNRAVEIFEYVLSFKTEPSMMSYSIMMKVFGKLNDFPSSKKLMDEVKKKSKNISLIIFTCYIKTCFSTKNIEEAISIYKQFKEFKLTADSITYTTLLKGLMSCHCDDHIYFILKDSLELNIFLNNSIYYDCVKFSRKNKAEISQLLNSYGIDMDLPASNTSSKDEANYYLLDNYKFNRPKKDHRKENHKPQGLQEKGKFYKNANNANTTNNEDKNTPHYVEIKSKPYENVQKPVRNFGFEKGQKYLAQNYDNKENEISINSKEKTVKKFNRF
jgi:pentatricopeptide repeat protein